MREAAARLALATAIVPPPQMRERVLAAVPRTRQLPPSGRDPLTRAGQHRARRHIPLTRAGVTTGILTLAAAVAFLLVTTISTNHQLRQTQASNSTIAAVLAAPDARIKSVPTSAGGAMTAVTSFREQESVVTAADLSTLAGGRVYQLWVMTSAGTIRSAGLLVTSGSGSKTPVLAAGVLPGDRLAVTVEPAGGTAQPTTKPVVTMSVT